MATKPEPTQEEKMLAEAAEAVESLRAGAERRAHAHHLGQRTRE